MTKRSVFAVVPVVREDRLALLHVGHDRLHLVLAAQELELELGLEPQARVHRTCNKPHPARR